MALADRLNEVTDVQRPVAIVPIELVPVARKGYFPLPLPEERRLAISGIRRDNDRSARGRLVQPVDEARAA
jgi:hypothetical protein